MSEYSASSIVVLELPEAIRRRPGMYVGDVKHPEAVHMLLYVAIDRALDHHVVGAGNRIVITLGEDGSATVEDEGRGIDFDRPEGPGEVARKLLTSYPLPDDPPVRGLHHLGLCVSCALSSSMTVDSFRNGARYRVETSRGRVVVGPSRIDATSRTGTRITFTPDPQIFTTVASFDPERIAARLRELAAFYPRVHFELRHQGRCTLIARPAGLANLVDEMTRDRPRLLPFVISMTLSFELDPAALRVAQFRRSLAPGIRREAQLALCFVEGGGTIASFAREEPNREGGSHVWAMRGGIVQALKAGSPWRRGDSRRVLDKVVGAVWYKGDDAHFGGGTTWKLDMPEIEAPLTAAVGARIKALLSEYPSLREKLLPPPA